LLDDPFDVASAAMVRIFMPFMMHIAVGPILLSGHAIPGLHPLVGIVAAILYHGAYDALLMGAKGDIFVKLAYGMVIGGLILATLIYRAAAGTRGPP
jgi:hypothetical protein